MTMWSMLLIFISAIPFDLLPAFILFILIAASAVAVAARAAFIFTAVAKSDIDAY
jgi:hypothetical protein